MKAISDFRFSPLGVQAGRMLLGISVAALVALALPADAAAQGCAMCYTSASAARRAGMEALQDGVFILLFPPLLMFALILWQTLRRRNSSEIAKAPAQAPGRLRRLES
jgi:hypothetical protein